MRSEPNPGPRSLPSSCPACGNQGLTDLRHTPTAYALSSYESESLESQWSRYLAFGAALGLLTTLGGLLFLNMLEHTADIAVLFEGGFLIVLLALLALPFVPSRDVNLPDEQDEGAGLPRRWRLPRLGKVRQPSMWAPQMHVEGRVRSETGDLLRSPLSGLPCVAYEIAVGPADPGASMSQWTLLEQRSVGFHVGETEVPADDALLGLPRQLLWSGVLAKQDESVKRFMRMRGLLEGEEIHVYETVLAPGDRCRLTASTTSAPAHVTAS